ncbi:MAG: hypothetical protein ACRCSB_02045 [Bacteroidales bacterium]
MKNKIPVFILFLFLALSTTAQEVNEKVADTLSRVVEVSRAYEATLPTAHKINTSPKINDSVKFTPNFNYSLLYNKPLSETYMLTPLSPAKLQSEETEQFGNAGLIRFGFGYKTSSLFDAYYGSESAKKFVWSIFANHRGNYGTVKNKNAEYVPNTNMSNEIGSMGIYHLENGEIKTNIGYIRKDTRFYGYDADSFRLSDYKETNPIQHFNTFYAKIGYDNPTFLDTSSTLRIAGGYYFHNTRFDQMENGVNFEAIGTKKLRQTTTAQLAFLTDFYQYNAKEYSSLAYELSLSPQLTESREKWEASLELDFTLLSKHNAKTAFKFFPSLSFSYAAIEDVFVPYSKVALFNDFISFASINDLNPFLNPLQNLDIQSPTTTKVGFGAKGVFGSVFNYNVELAYANVKQMVFFINSPTGLGNYFDVHNNDVNQFSLQSDIRLLLSRSFELKYALQYTHYKMKGGELSQAYNRPALMMNLEANYNLWNKLNLYASGDLFGNYYAQAFNGDDVFKKAGFYLNLGANYRFFNHSSAFIQLNNIFARRYEVFHNYASYGFNGMIGYAFLF